MTGNVGRYLKGVVNERSIMDWMVILQELIDSNSFYEVFTVRYFG